MKYLAKLAVVAAIISLAMAQEQFWKEKESTCRNKLNFKGEIDMDDCEYGKNDDSVKTFIKCMLDEMKMIKNDKIDFSEIKKDIKCPNGKLAECKKMQDVALACQQTANNNSSVSSRAWIFSNCICKKAQEAKGK